MYTSTDKSVVETLLSFVVLGGWSSIRELNGIQVQQLLVLVTMISSWVTIGKFAILAHKKSQEGMK